MTQNSQLVNICTTHEPNQTRVCHWQAFNSFIRYALIEKKSVETLCQPTSSVLTTGCFSRSQSSSSLHSLCWVNEAFFKLSWTQWRKGGLIEEFQGLWPTLSTLLMLEVFSLLALVASARTSAVVMLLVASLMFKPPTGQGAARNRKRWKGLGGEGRSTARGRWVHFVKSIFIFQPNKWDGNLSSGEPPVKGEDKWISLSEQWHD